MSDPNILLKLNTALGELLAESDHYKAQRDKAVKMLEKVITMKVLDNGYYTTDDMLLCGVHRAELQSTVRQCREEV